VKILRIQLLLLLLLWAPFGRLSAAPDLGESLTYTLSFRGLLSGFVEIGIAELTLSVEPSLEEMAGSPAYFARMQLTTAPYKKAELIYPVRLDYKSWLDERTLQPLVAVKSLVTGKSRQELFWFDWEEARLHHYQTAESDDSEPAQVPPPQRLLKRASLDDARWSGLRENKTVDLNQGSVIDYLSLLHNLRRLPAEADKWYEFTVFSGKKLEYYRVHVDKQRLIRRGWNRDTLHLKLYEFDSEKEKLKDEIQVWLSDDDQRLMLRFYAERAAGAMEGILDTGRPENGHDEGLPESTKRSLERYLDF
jgi:hypothetical protein